MADDLNINIGANPAGVEQGSRRAKVALKGVADGGRDLDAALRRLRSAIDPTYAAMERYNKAHQDNLALMRAGTISRKEYNAGMKAAKAALDAETASIERNSAAGKARIAEERAQRAAASAEKKAAAAEEVRLAREANAARRQAERESVAEAKRLRAEERAATAAAAAQAKALAREQAAVEKAAKREAAAAAKAALAETTAADRAAKAQERAAIKALAEEEKNARRQQKEAAREAARVAAEASKSKAAAEGAATKATKEAVIEAERLAAAEKRQAQAVQELRSSIDPAFAAQTRYNETMRRATQLLMTNKLQQGEWNGIQRQARAQMDLNQRSLGRQNAMYVQLGYQAQDVTASLASGINPLVILAQQGGQTASALSTMGGTAGKVAAFFAGPWGAAIIGATLLVGYLWKSLSEGEKATKDLMNAEDRRKMSVNELTQALKEYTDQQRKANETTLQGAINQAYGLAQAREDVILRMAKAQDALTAAQERYNKAVEFARVSPGPVSAAAVAAARVALEYQRRQVELLKKAYDDAQEAAMESAAAYAQTSAEMSDLDKKEQMEKQAALGKYRREYTAAGADRVKQAQITGNYERELVKIQERYIQLKKDETEARKKNEKAAKEEGKATYQSREQAIQSAGKEIQKSGFLVGENFGIGDGKVGKHPGMGREAHGKYAIDINMPGFGKGNNEADNAVAKARMDAMVKSYQARGFRVLWNGKVYKPYGQGASYDIGPGTGQHKDHAHMEAPREIVGTPSGGKLGNQMAQEAESQLQEALRLQEEQLRARVAFIEFEQELNREDLAMVLSLQDQKLEAIKEFYGETSEEAANAQRERVRIERAQARELLEITRDELDQRMEMAQAAADVENRVASSRRDAQAELIDFTVGSGMMDPREGIIRKAQLLDEEYAQQVAHEQRMLQLKRDNILATLALGNLSPQTQRDLNAQLQTIESQHLNNMTLMQQEHYRNIQTIQMESAAVTLRTWQDIGSTLSNSLTSTFQGIWTHSLTLHQAFINMADQMVYKFVDMGAQMFQEWFMRQVGMTAVQQAQDTARKALTVGSQAAETAAIGAATASQTGVKLAAAATEQTITAATTGAALAAEGIKTSAAITGAATQQSVGAAAGMAEIGTRAATSAAGAFSSTVVIPFIGPVAAPAAAAVALAAVLGFGALISARGGQGEVPFDGQLSMLHKKEMVLPEQFAVPLRQMLVGPRSSGGMMSSAASAGGAARSSQSSSNAANFYYQPNNTNMDASFDQMLSRDGRQLRKWLKNEVRNGGLKFS